MGSLIEAEALDLVRVCIDHNEHHWASDVLIRTRRAVQPDHLVKILECLDPLPSRSALDELSRSTTDRLIPPMGYAVLASLKEQRKSA